MSAAHDDEHGLPSRLPTDVDIVRPEDVIAGIWADVLELDDVEPDDDFFALGGDSLSAIQILTRISKRFNFKLTEGELFTARTVRGLCELLQHASHGGDAPAIAPHAGPRHEFPATSAQRRLWFLDRLIPNPEVYNVPFLIRMQGDVDVDALRTAFTQLEARHEVLRVHLEVRNGQPVQVVDEPQAFALPFTDLRHLAESERRPHVQREVTADAATPIALDGQRLYRAHVYRTGVDEFFLYLNLHHAITDGWSWGVLFKDAEAFYDAARNNTTPKLAPLSVQYGDFATWQQDYATSAACRSQLDYWKDALRGPTGMLDLPFSKPRPKTQTFRGGHFTFDIPKKLLNAVDKLSRQESVTRFMIGLAAFQTVLHRYTGQDDLLIGSPVANRNRSEVEPLLGMFVNTLILRTNLAGEPTFRELLERIRHVRMGAFAHQDVPLETLIEELRPPRDTSRQPYFQTAFYYQNVTIIPERLSRHKLTNIPLHNGTAMFDLRLVLEDGAFGSVWGWLEYNTDLYDEASMKRLVGHFLTVLEAACANPTQPIGTLPMLPKPERTQLLIDWNNTAGPYPDTETLTDAFVRQATATPDAIALYDNARTLTYGELQRQAAQFANYLRGEGVQPGELVAVSLPRSAEMIVAVLGISLAGGAYVPLDASYPADRLAFMLADTQARLLITHSTLRERFTHEHCVCVDELSWDTLPTTAVERTHTPDNIAYVIYTSGSTGKPKGVVVRHRAAVNTIAWVNVELGVTTTDKLLFVTSLSFDLSVYDIFGVLGAGGSLRIATENELRDPATLATILRDEAITMWDSAPAALQQLVPFFRSGSPTLRLVMLSGDWIPVALPDQVRRVFPNARVISLGGATEAAIWSNWFDVGIVDPTWPSIPYGKPIRNARYHVLNAALQPQPIGVPGELFIGGTCLADGYLNRAELTAERFIADPFTLGERLYRTGDLARYLPDGNLQFLGRADQQVKVRGFRVEIGEIETALAQHPNVRDAVVKAFRGADGVVDLAAFVVAKETIPTAALTRFLQLTLPDYMIPASVVFMDTLPTTPNGKLDRAALQAPTRTPTASTDEAPQSALESTIANVFGEVLGVANVGRHANFFELGGHSLKAAELVARLEETLGVTIKLAALFDQPTPAGLAAYASQQHPNLTPPLQRDEAITYTAPLAPTQRRFWLADRFLRDSAAYNVCDVVRIQGSLDLVAFSAALNTLVERHAALRTIYRETPELVQVVLPMKPVPLLVDDLTDSTDKLQALIEREAQTPFDLTTGPVARFRIAQLSVTEAVFISTIHHIAYDEASRGVFLRELFTRYTTGVIPANDHAPRYLDFAAWERTNLAGAAGERLLAAWQEQLAGAPLPVSYPAQKSRPAKPTGAGETLNFTLPDSVATNIARLAQQESTTPFVIVATAWQAFLARVNQQPDICVLTPAQVRPNGTANLVGCFVNTLPLRTNFANTSTFRDAIHRTHRTVGHALANAALPYDRLLETLRPAQGPDGQALAKTAIIHEDSTLGGTHGELRWQLEQVVGVGAKFDLTLGISTTAGWLEYSTDLYTPADAARIVAAFTRLLTTATTDASKAVDALPILAPTEEYRIAHEWRGTTAERPATPNLIALLDEQARRTPDTVALVVEHDEFTYSQLHARSNQLARHLQTLGIGPETLVGVCMERTADLPIAILAVLKAGGAYVPLDPAYPQERVRFMLDDAQAKVLLTQQRLLSTLLTNAPVLCVDDPKAAWHTLPNTPVECSATLANTAYVIYTSGSTGQPKGVVIEHRSVVEFVHWGRDTFTCEELAGVLFSTSVCFDLSVFELFVTLATGGTIILAPHALQLPTLPACDRVTLINTVPSAANELVRAKAIPANVRTINLAGEPLPAALVQQLHAVPNLQRVCNLYGPTEDTTYSTGCDVAAGEVVHIGRPLPNTTAHILNAQQQPVPLGVPGELYLGGAGLARGYLNRPELTAEKFAHVNGERLYRTGDLCRWREDGTIDYLGRIDHQVKIRGFRIELGEIENALARSPGVKQCVVIAEDDPTAGKRLVAYLGAVKTDTTALREQLKQTLPDYMVPSVFVVLPELPLTPNGKIDRKALPAVEIAAASIVAPANDAERALQTIWQDVLKIASISVTSRFEELGGHSLAAAAIMARIAEQLGHKLPLETIFQAPTIRQLAEVITQKLEVGGGVIVPLQEQGERAPLFLIAGAGGHVFAFHKFARLLGHEVPVYGMKAIGVEGDEAPLDRIEAIAARYLEEIVRVRPTGPYVLGGYSVGGIVAYELALQMQKRGLEVARVIAFDTFAPGYPRKKSLPLRMLIHACNFVTSKKEAKWRYLADRWHNLRERLYRRVGLGHLVVPEPPGVGGLSADVLRRVWAALDDARLRYWPSAVFDGKITVMRSDKREEWAATKLDDPHLGWNRWTTHPVQAFGMPVGHMELFSDANIDLMVADMRDVLESIPERPLPPKRDTGLLRV